MDYTDSIDPNNRRTAPLRNYVERTRQLTADISRLETKRRTKAAEFGVQDQFDLARCYFESGKIGEAGRLSKSLVDAVGQSDDSALKALSMMLLEARMDADAEKAITKYLKLKPKEDAMMWAELAKIQRRAGKREAAQQSFIEGYKLNGRLLFERLQKDQELYQIAEPLFQRRK